MIVKNKVIMLLMVHAVLLDQLFKIIHVYHLVTQS